MYFVYILLSKNDRRTYVGFTKDVEARLREHNTGRVTATRHRVPFSLFLKESYQTLQEAKQRERWWKSGTGRSKLKKIFKEKFWHE